MAVHYVKHMGPDLEWKLHLHICVFKARPDALVVVVVVQRARSAHRRKRKNTMFHICGLLGRMLGATTGASKFPLIRIWVSTTANTRIHEYWTGTRAVVLPLYISLSLWYPSSSGRAPPMLRRLRFCVELVCCIVGGWLNVSVC